MDYRKPGDGRQPGCRQPDKSRLWILPSGIPLVRALTAAAGMFSILGDCNARYRVTRGVALEAIRCCPERLAAGVTRPLTQVSQHAQPPTCVALRSITFMLSPTWSAGVRLDWGTGKNVRAMHAITLSVRDVVHGGVPRTCGARGYGYAYGMRLAVAGSHQRPNVKS